MTCEAPETTGCAPGAAFHTTGWPAAPESAAPRVHVLDRRYVPSASSTVTSAELFAARCARTALWAAGRAHGDAEEQAEPEPDGEA